MKSVKSYLLEFLMISIAVFLGFWAESFRNQISDNKKVMQIKKAIGKDLKKDLKQLDEYTNQAKFNLLMIDRMDSLVSLNPNFIDQKDFYKTLVSYSVVYKFTPSDKSLKQAEEMGVLQNEHIDSLSFFSMKYQYFLTDIRFVEDLLTDEYLNYSREIIPKMTDPILYSKVWRFPFNDLESKMGIYPLDKETKNNLRFFMANARWYYDAMQVNADSMRSYGNKMIQYIEH